MKYLFKAAFNDSTENDKSKLHSIQKSEEVEQSDSAAKSANEKKAEHNIFLTNYFDESKSIRQTSFGCEDKIYAVIQFTNHSPKLHQIEIEWTDPHGEVRELNNFPYFISGEIAHAWASLSLYRSVGAGMLQWINPAAGMEEFIGNWTLSVKVGDIIHENITFEVLC